MSARRRSAILSRLPRVVDSASITEVSARLAKVEKELRGLRKQVNGAPAVEIDEPTFQELARAVRVDRRTMLGVDRLWVLWQAAHNTAALDGAAVEIGTYRGGSAAFLARALATAGAPGRTLHVIDTFAGHPEEQLSEHDADAHKGGDKFKATSFEDVRDYLSGHSGVVVHHGDFASIAPTLPVDEGYSLVHVDVDIYGPALACLDFFGPRLAVGGVIVLDDYGAPTCPGIGRAADEFLAVQPSFQSWHAHTEQLILVKLAR